MYVVRSTIFVTIAAVIFEIGSGLTQFKILIALLTLDMTSTVSWISPLGIIKSMVYSELALHGIRTVCPSFWYPSSSVRVTVTNSLQGTYILSKSTTSPELKVNVPHLNISPIRSE